MLLTTLVATAPVLTTAVLLVGILRKLRREDSAREELEASRARGANLPISLHPVVDTDTCIGSGACVDACPEKALTLVDGRSYLVDAGSCIGHGACRKECPIEAISLVFGTAERGVDLPVLDTDFQSNVPGIYIVGELGGMGLIRNAMRQGLQVVPAVAEALETLPPARKRAVDVVIIGAGPAGIAAGLQAQALGLSYVVLEQYQLGGSVTHYPRKKLVMTERVDLPLVGRFGRSEMSKEELIEGFADIVEEADLTVREGRRVTGVRGRAGDFLVEANGPKKAERYRARTIVLAIGRRGTPRKLEVPGEDAPHVVYRLIDAEQYRRRSVLVVGGGDSAVEAALAIAGVAGSEVHLSYRRSGFSRIKRKNRLKLEEAVADGKIELHLQTAAQAISPEHVDLDGADGRIRLSVQDVIVCVGGILPTPFLTSLGIEVETKHGEPWGEAPDSRRWRRFRQEEVVRKRCSGKLPIAS